ncbi:MAG: helix-turn-helix domain-containing protein [Sphingomonadales bacterium]|nr:helix-turn-helix domain-containing protein [Sphingomonadales bacterium]MDE2171213.1 helix-turn-helix domain-containing protein [Sphingomonadales bacterium]
MASVNNIGALREKEGWSRPELARRMGTSTSQVERLEKGQRLLKPHWIDRAAAAFGVEPAAIITPLSGDAVAVVGYVGAGGDIIFEDSYAPGDGMYHVDSLPGLGADGLIGLEVRGDSMYPFFRNGHIIFIRRDNWDRVEDEALSDWAVCRLSDGRTLLKEVRPSRVAGHYDLISQNAPPIEDVELVWATAVKGHLRNR